VSEEPEVLIRMDGAAGRITLNRPQALNALNTGMCLAIAEALLAWQGDDRVSHVVIDGAGERAFCAGGDIRMVAASGAADGVEARRFFHAEYRMNELLHRYAKPVVAVMDGITMGGGVGISAPASHRIATERTMWAMPETGIGLFPDVGGGWHLPRLPGRTGLWLAETGQRLGGADCLALGIASRFVESSGLAAVEAALVDGQAPDAVLAEHGSSPEPTPLLDHRAQIDRLFGGPSVEAIFAALDADGSDLAAAQLATLKTKSPQTLKVTFRQLQLGAAMASFVDEMVMEYRLASRVTRRHDFIEGVRAVIIDKDNAPRWDPPDLAGVSEALLDELFAPLPPGEEWTPLP
jgi:enoyl-CoA hydratase